MTNDSEIELINRLSYIIMRGSIPHHRYSDLKFLMNEIHESAADARVALSLLHKIISSNSKKSIDT